MRNFTPIMPKDFYFFGDGRDGILNTIDDVSFESILNGPPVFKFFRSMKINEGHTVTVDNSCGGLIIYCLGDCIINGTLSMTRRGSNYNSTDTVFTPEKFDKVLNNQFIFKDLSIYRDDGGSRGSRRGVCEGGSNTYLSGYSGSAGINGACGGGGAGGAVAGWGSCSYSGYGGHGGIYGGGAGGGGCACNDGGSYSAQNGGHYGGKGGNGRAVNNNPGGSHRRSAGGGAGNPEGSKRISGSKTSGNAYNGDYGCGGLLILVVKGHLIIGNNGIISSNGSRGGSVYGATVGTGGGGSGGGSITLLSSMYTNNGTIQANGGWGPTGDANGGSGGAGSIRFEEILHYV